MNVFRLLCYVINYLHITGCQKKKHKVIYLLKRVTWTSSGYVGMFQAEEAYM